MGNKPPDAGRLGSTAKASRASGKKLQTHERRPKKAAGNDDADGSASETGSEFMLDETVESASSEVNCS